MTSERPAEIGLVLYPGVQLAAVHGLTDLFGIANRLSSAHRAGTQPALRVTHWRAGENGGVLCDYDSAPGTPARPETILIPLLLVELPPPETTAPLAEWLRARHAAGAVIGSICSGVFLLAQADLLAGRTAATHWSYLDVLAARFPGTRFDVDSRILDHGDIITVGGFMAWTDLGLRLVTRLLGPTIGSETARFLTLEPEPAKPHYLNGFVPKLTHGDAAVLRAQHWLHGMDARRVSLTAMAAQARLEKRTFLRRFANATGMTPLEYCRRVRIARARELLEFSNKTLKEIAWEIGYADAGAFARAFQRAMGRSPRDYRLQYGVARETASAQQKHKESDGSTPPSALLRDSSPTPLLLARPPADAG
jgi:transcriptional regulator GlxA family with amidase domain